MPNTPILAASPPAAARTLKLGLNTTCVYSPIVLEAGRLKRVPLANIKVLAGLVLSGSSRGESAPRLLQLREGGVCASVAEAEAGGAPRHVAGDEEADPEGYRTRGWQEVELGRAARAHPKPGARPPTQRSRARLRATARALPSRWPGPPSERKGQGPGTRGSAARRMSEQDKEGGR